MPRACPAAKLHTGSKYFLSQALVKWELKSLWPSQTEARFPVLLYGCKVLARPLRGQRCGKENLRILWREKAAGSLNNPNAPTSQIRFPLVLCGYGLWVKYWAEQVEILSSEELLLGSETNACYYLRLLTSAHSRL